MKRRRFLKTMGAAAPGALAGVDAVVTSFPARLRALVDGGIALCNAGAAAPGPEL